jgi:hypothetical protein
MALSSTYVELNARKRVGADGGGRPHNEKRKCMISHDKPRGAPPAPPCGRAPTFSAMIANTYPRVRARTPFQGAAAPRALALGAPALVEPDNG